MTTPIGDPHQRLTYLETRLARLEAQEQTRLTIGKMGLPRDVFLVRTVEIPGEGEAEGTYPAYDSGDTYFPCRFVDADFDIGGASDGETQLDNRTTDTEALTKMYLVGGGYLPEGTLCAATQQRGLRDDTETVERGEWWIITPGVRIVKGKTTEAVSEGATGEMEVWDSFSDLEGTGDLLTATNLASLIDSGAEVIAVMVGTQWFYAIAPCSGA